MEHFRVAVQKHGQGSAGQVRLVPFDWCSFTQHRTGSFRFYSGALLANSDFALFLRALESLALFIKKAKDWRACFE